MNKILMKLIQKNTVNTAKNLFLVNMFSDEKIFCCQGCVSVYGILNSNGLSDYYETKEGP